MHTIKYFLALALCFATFAHAQTNKQLHLDVDVRAPFYALPMSNVDCDRTYQLIDQMGNKPWYELLWHKRKMEKLGDQVDHVHPMRFAGYIFSHGHLKDAMKKVRAFGLKWSRFISGFGGKMNRNADQNNLLIHVAGFCHQTGADPDFVKGCIERRQWEQLISHCIDR